MPSSLEAMWLRGLFTGEKATSFPLLLHDRVYADFRKEEDYFVTAFELILSLYGIALSDPAVADVRESLCERRMRQGTTSLPGSASGERRTCRTGPPGGHCQRG